MWYCNKKLWFRITINSLLLITIIILGVLSEFGYLPYYISGFYLNDPNISMPYYENDTISTTFLVLMSIFAPLVIMLIGEYFNNLNKLSPTEVKKALQLSYLWYRDYIVGLSLNILLIQTMKLSIGKPRPCFMEVCKPNVIESSATGYVYKFQCTNTDVSDHTILDVSRSFPSGHSSISVQTSLYIFLYVSQRVRSPWMLGISIQVLCLLWGSITPISRIIDYRHHWWDVLAGAIIGVVITWYSVYILNKNFCTAEKSSSKYFNLVIDRLSSKKLNHVVDNNNISRDVEMQPV